MKKILILFLVVLLLGVTPAKAAPPDNPVPVITLSCYEDCRVLQRIYVEGTILSKQMTARGDNLILSISNLNVKVFISKDSGAKEIYANLKTGDKVRINGKVADYMNAREIVVESASDVKGL